MNVPYNILRGKCPNTELFLVRIFPHSGWIRRDTKWNVSYWFTANLIQPAFGICYTQRENCPKTDIFCSVFSCIRTRKKLLIGTFFTQWQHKMLMKAGLKQCLKIYLSFSQIRFWFKINTIETPELYLKYV